METVQIFFRVRSPRNVEEAIDKVYGYLAALLHNGQIVDEHLMAKVRGGYLVVATLPETDALAERFGNKWVRRGLRQLATVGLDRPKVTHLGPDPEDRATCKCRTRPFLILFTTFLHVEPPVRCGACFGPIALYRLPASNEARIIRLRSEPLHSLFDFQCRRCRLLSNIGFDVRLV
jgi:predicted  nucleic acid-binding Zn ribbon protein